jgi:hypothetical protein
VVSDQWSASIRCHAERIVMLNGTFHHEKLCFESDFSIHSVWTQKGTDAGQTAYEYMELLIACDKIMCDSKKNVWSNLL